jgi:acetyl esterase
LQENKTMPLSTESQAVLDILAKQGVKAFDELPVTEGRDYFNNLFAAKAEDRESLARVEELTIEVDAGSIAARLYAPASDTPLPVLVHYHGGGWVYMNLESHDGYCRKLAKRSGCAVLAVEYRKAPEYPFPIPFEDCYQALEWTQLNAAILGLDANRLGVVGDSAGGNLAAAVAIATRDRGGPPLRAQILTYPAVDATASQPSVTENEHAPLLGKAQMDWFWGHYVDIGTDKSEAYLSPLHAPNLDGLAAALVATAEFDPLRDEGNAYAKRLMDSGVDVEHLTFMGVFHGFMLMEKIIPQGAQLVDAQVAFIKQHLL